MKSQYLSLALLAFLLTACNNTPKDETNVPVDESQQVTEPAPVSTQETTEPVQEPVE